MQNHWHCYPYCIYSSMSELIINAMNTPHRFRKHEAEQFLLAQNNATTHSPFEEQIEDWTDIDEDFDDDWGDDWDDDDDD